MKRKSQINPTINESTKNALMTAAKLRSIPYGLIVDAAISQYLDPDSFEEREAIMFKRLDEISRKLDHLSFDLSLFSEGFALFIRNYLARIPSVPAEDLEAFIAQKEKAYAEFISSLSDSVQMGNNLRSRLPEDVLSIFARDPKE